MNELLESIAKLEQVQRDYLRVKLDTEREDGDFDFIQFMRAIDGYDESMGLV